LRAERVIFGGFSPSEGRGNKSLGLYFLQALKLPKGIPLVILMLGARIFCSHTGKIGQNHSFSLQRVYPLLRFAIFRGYDRIKIMKLQGIKFINNNRQIILGILPCSEICLLLFGDFCL
jgi:hypothetical protein